MSAVAIIGGRGNGTVIADTARDAGFEIAGWFCDGAEVGDAIDDAPVLGPVCEAVRCLTPLVFALHTVKKAEERLLVLERLDIPAHRFATIIHPTAYVARSARLGRGVVLMPNVVVGPGCAIGDRSQVYAGGFVGHDATLEEGVFVANNASIGAAVRVSRGAHIGSNCSIRERVNIGEYAVVGLGAVVLQDVPPRCRAVGNPARILERA